MIQLLVDGKNAFPQIIKCIENARTSIFINMFIWRNDSIGNDIAIKILDAADRGVKIVISKDRYGIICESCEENRKSFFNRMPSLTERIKIEGLSLLYNNDAVVKHEPITEDSGELLAKILRHPNIDVQYQKNKYDHSKFYVFDNSTVILGGINIEDKENGIDLAGRVYHDYMLVFDESELVSEFLQARELKLKPSLINKTHFPMNCKDAQSYFGMEDAYLDLINDANKELTIVMAYFSVLPKFEDAILAASKRGVDVKIVIPQKANFQDDLNKKAVNKLISKSAGKIRVYLYPGMLHAKLLKNENRVSFGSCNITKKAICQLDELNFDIAMHETEYHTVAEDITKSVDETLHVSTQTNYAEYSALKAFCEGLLL